MIFPLVYLSLTLTFFLCCFSFFFTSATHTVTLVHAHTPPNLSLSTPGLNLLSVVSLALSSWGPEPWMVLIKDLFWSRSSLLSEEHVQSMKIRLEGNATCLKWKWAQLLPLLATTRTHNGNSPSNLSVWINSKWIYYLSFFFVFLQKDAICNGSETCEELQKVCCSTSLSVNLGSVETLKAFDKHSYLEVRWWNMICTDRAESQSPRGVCLCVCMCACVSISLNGLSPHCLSFPSSAALWACFYQLHLRSWQ